MKTIFLLLFVLISSSLFSQTGAMRSLKTKSAKVIFSDLAGSGNKIVGVDNNGLAKNISVDGTTVTLINNVLSASPQYTLPTASTTVLGGVKVDGTTIVITNGVISGVSVLDTLFTTVAISDEITSLTVGIAKRTFRMPIGCTLTRVTASVTTAPTGAALIFDINKNSVSILSTKLSIDATEKTSKTAATPVVVSDAILNNDSEITIDIDQIGSTIAGTGVKIILHYIKN